jgi:predicted small metal-binding protein
MSDEMTVTCDCGWTARAPRDELVRKIQEHASDVHGLAVTPEQALAQARPVAQDAGSASR